MKKLKITNFCKLLILTIGFSTFSCTNLEEDVFSQLTGETYFTSEENLLAAFGVAYTNLYRYGGQYNFPSVEISTDLFCVPHRGADWFDMGRWLRIHQHEWTTNETYFDNLWFFIFQGISVCNQLLYQFDIVEDIDPDLKELAQSELKALRALYLYWGMDLFGNIPVVLEFPVEEGFLPSTTSRAEVYTIVESELLEALPGLTKEKGLNTYGRMTYYAAQAVLSKLYLNAEVYKGSAELDKANTALDSIIGSGLFSLESNYLNNFSTDASGSPEVIFGIPYDANFAQGNDLHYFSLPYALSDKFNFQNNCWNGVSALEDFYNLFESDDTRLGGLLTGELFDNDGNQYQDPDYEAFDPLNPTAAFDTDGPGWNITPEINELQPRALRQAGARIIKFEIEDGIDRWGGGDLPIFRYADVLLMKAEVEWRKGNSGDALSYVNMVRARAGVPDISSIDENVFLEERAKELYMEGHRRTDLVRFGKYTSDWWEKPAGADDHYNLFPIPAGQLDANPNLDQNTGY